MPASIIPDSKWGREKKKKKTTEEIEKLWKKGKDKHGTHNIRRPQSVGGNFHQDSMKSLRMDDQRAIHIIHLSITFCVIALSFFFVFFFSLPAKRTGTRNSDHCFSQGKKNPAVNLSVLPSLPPLCSLLINWDFAWLNFKRPLEKNSPALAVSHSIFHLNYGFLKVKALWDCQMARIKKQQCSNYVTKKWRLCDVSSYRWGPFRWS